MIRLRGDRTSLLAALLAHWSERQLALPPVPAAGRSARGGNGPEWLG
ncbi:MAG: hypothetical protein ACKOZN_06640 [Cyanobium sp.]